MTRDNEIAAIFNPRRVRAPSVVVTGDSPNGSFTGGFTNIINSSNPQIGRSDSICQPDGTDTAVGIQGATNLCNSTTHASASTPNMETPPVATSNKSRYAKCKESCCSELAQKMYFGVCVTILVTASWVSATHCIKFLYVRRSDYHHAIASSPELIETSEVDAFDDFFSNSTKLSQMPTIKYQQQTFNAPFFASWFFTNFALLFFPIYLVGRVTMRKCDESPGEILGNVLRGFRDRGFTAGRFLNRCMMFCLLWLATTYLYVLSLRALFATDAMALFATNVACAYLLSWVILHEQFVGVRIVAVILCDTGIALLAYMDGITGSPTLGGVVLATLSAAGYAVFKVMFRKVMGDPPVAQIAFTFTMLGFINASLCWPISLALYLTGAEVMPWESLTWTVLFTACILMLVFHILMQFSVAVTYTMFVTLGLITSVPVSAALDIVLYGANFAGMKLAGVILISIGFFLVMFPNNWPDYITRLLRNIVRAFLRYQCCCEFTEIDYNNSKYHLVGSQREMETRSSKRLSFGSTSNCHRLSDGLHSFPSPFAVRSSEMTEFASQPHYAEHKQLGFGGGSRRALNRSSFSAIMMTTSLTADDPEALTHSVGIGGAPNTFAEHNSSVRRFFKRKFSVGSTD